MIAEGLAERLGDNVRLNTPVRSVQHGGVGVDTDRGRFYGRRLIVALPPTVAIRIGFDPGLPPSRDGYLQHVPRGY